MIGWVFWSEGHRALNYPAEPRRSQPHSSSKVYRTGHVHRFSEERLVRSHGRGLLLHYSRRSSGLDDCGSMCALGSTAANGRCSVWNKTCVIAIILQALWSLGRTAAVRAKSVGAPLRSNQMSIMNGTVAKRGIENRQVAPFLPSSTLCSTSLMDSQIQGQ